MSEHGVVRPDPSPLHPRRYFVAAGVLTGLVGLTVSTAAAWALRSRTTPIEAVAEGVRDLVPGEFASWLVHLVGRWDKPLLLLGTTLGLVLITALAGLLARRHPLWSDFLLVAVTGLGLVALIRASGIVAGMTILLGFVAMILSMRLLVAPLRGEVNEARSQERRVFLMRAGAVVAVGAAMGGIGRFAGRARRVAEQSRRLVRVPGTKGVVPQGARLSVDGLLPWRTAEPDFYQIDTTLAPPSIKPDEWQLRIHGLVDHEVTFSYAELLRMTPVEGWVTLACVSNPVGGDLVGNAWWTGVPVRTVLERAGVLGDADAVLQTSSDGWTCLTPLEALTDDRNALLAYGMNGEPLSIDHGFPVRVVVPGLYGYVSATKWVVDLEVTRFDKAEGYWTPRGWSAKGPIKTQSRIDVPAHRSSVPAGVVAVGGVAWAPHTGISTVEYSVDGGVWKSAGLGAVPGNDTWVQWAGEIEVSPGSHDIRVRATDSRGRTQTEKIADVLPDGATGWHTVSFDAEA